MLRALAKTLFRSLIPFAWFIMGKLHVKSERKRVLLVIGNDMTARYVGAVKALFGSDPRISFSSTEGLGLATAAKAHAENLNAPYLSRKLAIFRYWDLILFAAHHAPSQFHPDIPKLYIHHSYDSGKKSGGEDHRYGRHFVLDPSGAPVYTSFLEMSHATKNRVAKEIPVLADRIQVVGDLIADDMLGRQNERAHLREEMGFAPSDRVILIMSTFGAESLMETVGEALITSAKELASSYRFILSTHPNHWTGPYSQQQPWGKRLLQAEEQGFTVIHPQDDWVRFAIASDACISDHTSLAVTYAILRKPMMFVPVPRKVMTEGAIGTQLYDTLPRVESPAVLAQTLEALYSDFPMAALESISSEINSYPGEAAPRIRAELYRLLGVAAP